MEMFAWSKDYETGVNTIDEQHKVLVDYLNQLFEAMKKGEGKKILDGILDGLVKYTVVHFTTEEQLMVKNNYPDVEKHKVEHKKLVDSVKQFQEEVKTSKITITNDVYNYLKDWLSHHIMESDKIVGKYLLSNPAV